MIPLTSHTYSETEVNDSTIYELFYNKVMTGNVYSHYCQDFESFYVITNKCIDHFESKEEYEKCSILKKNLDLYFNNIPQTSEEAVKYLFKIKTDNIVKNMKKANIFSMAIKLHHTIGNKLIDMWLLKFKESPLKQHYNEMHDIYNHDEIIHDILKKYISTIKSISEA